MAYYVKVKPEVRNRILPEYIGTNSADGNVILFQSDLNGVEGLTLNDRVFKVGGSLLSPEEAKKEIDGTILVPAVCVDPAKPGSEVNNNQKESEVNNG